MDHPGTMFFEKGIMPISLIARIMLSGEGTFVNWSIRLQRYSLFYSGNLEQFRLILGVLILLNFFCYLSNKKLIYLLNKLNRNAWSTEFGPWQNPKNGTRINIFHR